MKSIDSFKDSLDDNGFAIINNIYTSQEIETIISEINSVDTSNPTFRKSINLFAVR